MSDDTQLPIGWSKVPLIEVTKFIDYRGKTPKKTDTGIPLITAKNVKKGYINEEPKEFINPNDYENWMTRGIPNPGDVLMTTEAPLGNVAQLSTNKKIALAQRVITFQPYLLNQSFLKYTLLSPYFQIELDHQSTGTTVKGIKASRLKNIEILIPPDPEQHRIVDKIEELFSELDNGVENLKKAQAQLKTYRQAVLKYAFEGKLTEDWRKKNNPEPAEKLLEQIKAEREKHYQQQLKDWETACEQAKKDGAKKPVKPKKPKDLPPLTDTELKGLPELPEGWCWGKLANISLDITDGDHQPPPKSASGIPFITISNINGNKINFTNTYFVDSQYFDNLKMNRKPQNGDVLFTVTGSFGIPVLVNFDKQFCFQRHIGLVRPAKSMLQKYVYFLLLTSLIYKQAETTATGTAQKTVSLNSLRNFIIPLLSINEQAAIIEEIETRLSVCDKIEQNIADSLKQSEALRQSILKKAFEGKLVPQDPNDEPAEKLLERIKAEKEKLEAEIKSKKKTVKKRKKATA